MRRWGLVLLVALGGCGGGGAPHVQPGIDWSAIDYGGDPCSDFYEYACGTWLLFNPVGPDGNFLSRENDAFYATESAARDLLAAPPQSSDAQLSVAYDTDCLQAGSAAGRASLDSLLAQITAAQSGATLAAAVAALHDAGVSALFSFGATRDLMQPANVIASAGEGGFGLPVTAYNDASIISAYRDHITMLSSLLGVSDPSMANDVVRIESALAAATLTPDQRRDPLATYHIQPLAMLSQAAPDFDFASYLAAEGVPPPASVNVANAAFFTALEQVLSTNNLAALERYLRWRAIEAFAGTLDDSVIAEEVRFHDGTFAGFSQPLPRDEYCLRQTVAALPWPMSGLYAGSRAGAVTAAEPIVARVRQALRDDLSGLEWLDDPTRAAALAKLDAVRAEVFAPADFGPYEPALTGLPPAFDDAYSAVFKDARVRSLAHIGGQDPRDWFLAAITVNAAYSPTLNAINVPAAILQLPMFDQGSADAVNLGAIGAVVGHELTHGFDDQGRKFDATGGLSDWWTPAIATQFNARAQCLIDQYNQIEIEPGSHLFVDGVLTLGENIADLGGVKLAYAAAAPSTIKTTTYDYSDAQAFFIAYAQSWCTNETRQLAEAQRVTDPHAPAFARVNAVLANTPEFAAAFSCPAGAPLAPANTCAVW